MPATLITPASRYFRAGIDRIYFANSAGIVAPTQIPTRTEMNAMKDISKDVMEVSGWTVTSGKIDTPDLASAFTGSIPGRTSVDDSSLTFYAAPTGADVRSLFPRLTEGFMVFVDGGDLPGNKMDIYPVRVGSVGKVRSVGDDAAQITVTFYIVREPVEDVPVPTAA